MSDIETWKAKIQLSQNYVAPFHSKWRTMIDLYRGKQWDDNSQEIDRVVVNYIFSTIRTILPSLFGKTPHIIVTPNRDEDIKSAELLERAVNYLWKELGLKEEVRRALLDGLIVGHGWIKIGYRVETVLLNTSSIKDRAKEAVAELDPNATNNFVDEYINDEEVWAKHISPFEIFVDPEAKNLSDARYVIHRMVKTLEEIKRDSNYKNTDKIKPTHIFEQELLENVNPTYLESDDIKRVVLWEIWDRESNFIRVVADGCDSFLRNEEIPYKMDGYPFAMLAFNDVPGEFYPISEVEIIRTQQLEINKIRSFQLDHIKRASRKILFEKGSLDDNQIEKLTNPEDMSLVEVNDISRIRVLEDITLPRDIFNVGQMQKDDIREMTGISEYQRGGFPLAKKTATEARIIQNASQSRSFEKAVLLENFTESVAKKVIQLVKQYYDRDKLITIVGDKGFHWRDYNREEIQKEYDVSVVAGSMVKPDSELEKLKAMEAFKLVFSLGTNPEISSIIPGYTRLLKDVLKRALELGFDLQGVDKYFQTVQQ